MNKLFKSIVAASVGVAMAIGVGVGLGREASAVYAAGAGTDVLFAKGFGSYTNNSFSAAGTDRTGVANGTNVSGVTYALQVFNGSTGAVRGNQNAGSANFSARNTTTQTGYYISSVSLTVSGGTIDGSTDGRSVVYFGSSAFGNPNSGAPSGTPTSATPASSGQTTLSWTNSDPDCNYFILYHLKTSGTALSANATTSLKVVWSPATKVAVSYVSEYGTLSKTSEQVLPGSTITLPTISNKPSNYSFEGFSDGNDNVYDEGETVTINSATTFTAIWREIKVLSSISVSGQTTTFEQGDAFVFGGTVTANYADSTSADVTSKAVFSGYDMVTAGNQTVTVSYTEGQITKTTTYDITVNVISSIMFVGGTDVGSTSSNNSADSVTKAGITMSCTDAAFATTEYRFYGGSTLTFTSSVEKIARIEFTQCDNSRPVSNLGPAEGTLSSGVWTGTASTTVTFNPTAQVRASQVRASHVKVVLDNAAPVEGETEDHPFTVAQAKAHIDAVIAGGNDTGNNGSSYYVTGIVSSIVTPLTSGYITYNISDDGTTESQQLEVYKGKSFDGANFTEEDDIKVGAVVKVHGRLKLYIRRSGSSLGPSQ